MAVSRGPDDPQAVPRWHMEEVLPEVDGPLDELIDGREKPGSGRDRTEAPRAGSSGGRRRFRSLVVVGSLLALVSAVVVGFNWSAGDRPGDVAGSGATTTSTVQPLAVDVGPPVADGEAEQALGGVAVVEVEPAPAGPPLLRIGLVGPGGAADGSFTQSMVDGVALVAAERGEVQVEVVENVSAAAAAPAIRRFAEEGFDLVIAHSSAYLPAVVSAAREYPQVTFAVGTVREPSGLPNVYAYAIAAEEGGYVLGALAARVSESGVVGAIGPVEVGTSRRYIDGFRAGAEAVDGTTVLVAYTGSFSDGEAAASAASRQLAAGADVVTGHGHVMGPAIEVVDAGGARWLANQRSPTTGAPVTAVAAQVYHWDVGLLAIVDDIDNGSVDGANAVWIGDLANGGVGLDYGRGLGLEEADRDALDALAAAVASGAVDPLASG